MKSIENFISGERRIVWITMRILICPNCNAGGIQNVKLQCFKSILEIPFSEVILAIVFIRTTLHYKIVFIHC